MNTQIIDVITFFDDKDSIDVSLPRDVLYQIDKEFWQKIIEPESCGFQNNRKELYIVSSEDLQTSILVMQNLIGQMKGIDNDHVFHALLFLRRMKGPDIDKMKQTLENNIRYRGIGRLESFVDTPLEDVVPKQLLINSKGYGETSEHVRDWAWKWWFRPYLLNGSYDSDETWALLCLYQNGKIKKLPTMSFMYPQYWTNTPVWMHKVMKQVQHKKQIKRTLSICTVDNVRSRITADLKYKIAKMLCNEDLHVVAIVMYKFMQKFNLGEFHVLLRIFGEHYEQLTEKEAWYLTGDAIDPNDIINLLFTTPDDLLKYALMNPMTYIHAESYDDYNEYALEMKELCIDFQTK